MKILIAISLILLGFGICQAHDHSSSELSESQQVIRMFERDLGKELNKIRSLNNMIHSKEVPQKDKCQYIKNLSEAVIQFEMGLGQYRQLLSQYVNVSFDPNIDPSVAMVKLIVVEQAQNEARSTKSVLPILKRNHCGTVL